MTETTTSRPRAAQLPQLDMDRARPVTAGPVLGIMKTGALGLFEVQTTLWSDGDAWAQVNLRRPQVVSATMYGTADTVWVTAARTYPYQPTTTAQLVLDRAAAEELRDQLTAALEAEPVR